MSSMVALSQHTASSSTCPGSEPSTSAAQTDVPVASMNTKAAVDLIGTSSSLHVPHLSKMNGTTYCESPTDEIEEEREESEEESEDDEEEEDDEEDDVSTMRFILQYLHTSGYPKATAMLLDEIDAKTSPSKSLDNELDGGESCTDERESGGVVSSESAVVRNATKTRAADVHDAPNVQIDNENFSLSSLATSDAVTKWKQFEKRKLEHIDEYTECRTKDDMELGYWAVEVSNIEEQFTIETLMNEYQLNEVGDLSNVPAHVMLEKMMSEAYNEREEFDDQRKIIEAVLSGTSGKSPSTSLLSKNDDANDVLNPSESDDKANIVLRVLSDNDASDNNDNDGRLIEMNIEYTETTQKSTADSSSSYTPGNVCRADEYVHFPLIVIHRQGRTGFEEEKDFKIMVNDIIADRYQILEHIGSAAFSNAVQAFDMVEEIPVCMKIIKNNKDFFDQSLDEIKLLAHVNGLDPDDQFSIVRMHDYFYHREHLFIVFELLRANLYEVQRRDVDEIISAQDPAISDASSSSNTYFNLDRIRSVATQVLSALVFLHDKCNVIHADLKPENLLIQSYSECKVKIIDLGSSCFETDRLSGYVQSRSYRAPEVILGLPYGKKIDIWSLGCILAELANEKGEVLFTNDDLPCVLARMIGVLGPIPRHMLDEGCYARRYFLKNGMIVHKPDNNTSIMAGGDVSKMLYIIPKATSLRHRVSFKDDDLFIDFLSSLLTFDPKRRPTAAEALCHPWLKQSE